MNTIAYILVLNSLQTTSLAANKITLALFALELGASPLVVGLLTAMFSLAAATLAVPVGRLADRFGARWLLVTGAVGAACGLLLPWFLPSLTAVLVAGALGGLSLVCFNVTTQNLTGLFSTPQDRARNFSNYSLTMSGGQLLGPLAGGFLVEHTGHRLACLVLGLYALAPLLMLLARRGPLEEGALHRAKVKPTGAHAGGTLALFRDPGIRKTIITASFLISGLSMMSAYLPVYAHSIGLSASVIGIVVSMNALASFVIRALLPRMIAWLKEEKMMALSFCFGATAFALIPFFQHPVALGMLAFCFGLGMGAAQPVVTMLIFQYSPPGRSGEAIGLKITTNHITNMAAPLAFGAFAVAAGLATMFWLNALLMAAGCWISWPKARGGLGTRRT
jgi:MFS family permease